VSRLATITLRWTWKLPEADGWMTKCARLRPVKALSLPRPHRSLPVRQVVVAGAATITTTPTTLSPPTVT
jgi:hypothetical protein